MKKKPESKASKTISMKTPFTILVTDRNHNIRELLKREMVKEGYRIQLAKNGRDILRCIYHHEPIDLLILDPDLPDAGEVDILEKLEDRIPTLPVVIHAFLSEYVSYSSIPGGAAFVEKRGANIDRLKRVISDVLHESYPRRFERSKLLQNTVF